MIKIIDKNSKSENKDFLIDEWYKNSNEQVILITKNGFFLFQHKNILPEFYFSIKNLEPSLWEKCSVKITLEIFDA